MNLFLQNVVEGFLRKNAFYGLQVKKTPSSKKMRNKPTSDGENMRMKIKTNKKNCRSSNEKSWEQTERWGGWDLGEAEVRDDHVALPVQQQVLRLQVSGQHRSQQTGYFDQKQLD